MRRVKGAFLLHVLALSSMVCAQESSVVLNPVTDGADIAMALGNSDEIRAMRQGVSDPVIIELLDAYAARVELRIPDSNNHSERCAELARTDLPKYYMSNVRCRALRAGNELIDGDYHQWSRRLLSALDDVADFARREIKRGLPGKYIDDVKVYYPGTASLREISGPRPAFSKAGIGTTVDRVPIAKAPIPGPYWVEAKINDMPALFVLDTGGSATVIGGRTARKLGLNHEDLEGHADYNLVLSNESVSTRYGKIDSLQLGDFTATNITALVSDDDSVVNIIGLDLIGKMGGLRISSNQLTFEDTSTCAQKLRLASDPTGTKKAIVGTVDLDGRPVTADIDTGSGALLLAYGDVVGEPNGHINVHGIPGSITLSAAPHPLGGKFNLGTEILRSYDMLINIEEAAFCLASDS